MRFVIVITREGERHLGSLLLFAYARRREAQRKINHMVRASVWRAEWVRIVATWVDASLTKLPREDTSPDTPQSPSRAPGTPSPAPDILVVAWANRNIPLQQKFDI